MVTYCPHSKNTYNLKVMEFEILRISKYISKSQNLKNLSAHVNGVYKKLKSKVVSYIF
jgi:DNA-binding CsgD family transcriptional regulator